MAVSAEAKLWVVDQVLRMHTEVLPPILPVARWWPTRIDTPSVEPRPPVGCAQCPADGSACPVLAQALAIRADLGLRRVA